MIDYFLMGFGIALGAMCAVVVCGAVAVFAVLGVEESLRQKKL